MIQRTQLKATAKTQIQGNIGMLFLCSLVIGLIIVFTMPLLGAGLIMAPAVAVSNMMIYLNLTKGVKPQIGDVFKGFHIFGKVLWLFILIGLFQMLWSLIPVAGLVLGIMKMYEYSMAPYILAENQDMTAREALRESKRITQGYKGDLFVLQLSFIGWILLGLFTLGLLYIWLIPYMNASIAYFYLAIKGGGQAAASIQSTTVCPKCNHPLAKDARFCTSCGAKIVGEQSMKKSLANEHRSDSTETTFLSPSAKREAGFTGVSGTYTGAFFPLRDGEELIIGTDPKISSVVIDHTYNKVSRKHVAVKYAAAQNRYVVTDFSTNGTWVNDQRINPASPTAVQPGSLLRLADKNTLFLLN